MDPVPLQGEQPGRRGFLLGYAFIAFLTSWAVELPLALQAQGLIAAGIPFSLHYLAAFGPLIAGVILTWREKGAPGLKILWGRMFKWRVEPLWWLVALSPVLLFLLAAILMRLQQGAWLDFAMLGQVSFLADLGPWSLVLWLATYGFGEEVGWRGYLLPRLQRDRTAWSATLILWIVWAIWHAPSFFYLQTVTGMGALAGFLLGVLGGAIFLTWLYNSSGGSILLVAVWHGLFDYVTACTQCKSGLVAAVLSTMVMVWAVVVVVVFKRTHLSRMEKQVA